MRGKSDRHGGQLFQSFPVEQLITVLSNIYWHEARGRDQTESNNSFGEENYRSLMSCSDLFPVWVPLEVLTVLSMTTFPMLIPDSSGKEFPFKVFSSLALKPTSLECQSCSITIYASSDRAIPIGY